MPRRKVVSDIGTSTALPFAALRELEAGSSGLLALCEYLALRGADPEPDTVLSAIGLQQLLEGPRMRIDRAHELIRTLVLGVRQT